MTRGADKNMFGWCARECTRTHTHTSNDQSSTRLGSASAMDQVILPLEGDREPLTHDERRRLTQASTRTTKQKKYVLHF